MEMVAIKVWGREKATSKSGTCTDAFRSEWSVSFEANSLLLRQLILDVLVLAAGTLRRGSPKHTCSRHTHPDLSLDDACLHSRAVYYITRSLTTNKDSNNNDFVL